MYKSRKQLNCTTCNKKLFGRCDKRFCGDHCKNKYHRETKKYMRSQKVDGSIKSRNLIVLLGIFGTNTRQLKLHQDLLFHYGFDVSKCDRIISLKGQQVFCFQFFRFSFKSNGLIEITRIDNRFVLPAIFFDRWKADFPEDFFVIQESYGERRNFSFERLSYFDDNKRLAYC